MKLIKYWSNFEIFGSDHRPVFCLFKTHFKKHKKDESYMDTEKME